MGSEQHSNTTHVRPAIASAPGKTILFGEHSVVYGMTAVATAVNLRSYALILPPTEVSTEKADHVTLYMPDVSVAVSVPVMDMNRVRSSNRNTSDPAKLSDSARAQLSILITKYFTGTLPINENQLNAATAVFFLLDSLCPAEIPALVLLVRSEIPIGSGLGSSASFSVAVITSIIQGFGLLKRTAMFSVSSRSLENDLLHSHNDGNKPTLSSTGLSPLDFINSWALVAEMIIHGNPSGVDNTIVTFGGALSYTRSNGMEKISNLSAMEYFLVDSRVKKDTKIQLSKVRTCQDLMPTVIPPILDAMNQIAITGCKALTDPGPEFSELIRINHTLLCALNTSHPALDDIVSKCRAHLFSAKLTGAGGGGCVLVYLDKNSVADRDSRIQLLRTKLVDSGYHVFRTQVGGRGVRVHDVETRPHPVCGTNGTPSHNTWESVFNWMKQEHSVDMASVVGDGHEVCWAG